MDKRAKVILLIGGVLLTAGIIYWLTRPASGSETENNYVPNTDSSATTNPDGSTATPPPQPPMISKLSVPIKTSKGDAYYRVVTYVDGGQNTTYLDANKNVLNLKLMELMALKNK